MTMRAMRVDFQKAVEQRDEAQRRHREASDELEWLRRQISEVLGRTTTLTELQYDQYGNPIR